jgi:hypothetical protein
MADRLAGEIDRRPDDLLIVLTGNLHNRLVPGRSEPMGYHLVLLRPQAEVLALNLTYGGGTAWVCTRDGCGVRGMGGEEGTRLGIEIDPNAAEGPYSGRLHVGTVTASPPARERGQ